MENINEVRIIGTLAKADTKEITSKNGGQFISVEAQVEEGGNTFNVRFFAGRTKADNTDNPMYDQYNSIQYKIGSRVNILGSLEENPWYDAKNKKVKTSVRVNGRFISDATITENDTATFKVSGFILSALTEQKNKDGVAYRYDINVAVPNYNGTKIQNITLNTSVVPAPGTTDMYYSAELIEALSTLRVGQSIKLSGDLISVVTTETVEEKHGFGKPTYKTYTNVNKRFNITAGDVVTEDAIDMATVKELVSAYKASLAEVEAKGIERANSNGNSNSGTASNTASVSQANEVFSLL